MGYLTVIKIIKSMSTRCIANLTYSQRNAAPPIKNPLSNERAIRVQNLVVVVQDSVWLWISSGYRSKYILTLTAAADFEVTVFFFLPIDSRSPVCSAGTPMPTTIHQTLCSVVWWNRSSLPSTIRKCEWPRSAPTSVHSPAPTSCS